MQHLSLLSSTTNLPVAAVLTPPAGRNSPTNFEHRWCRSGCEPRCQTSLVNDSALIRARAGDHQAFAALTDPYRRELQLHCYRILGQVQDAEDAVQETLLSAWRALESFEERSTLRSWLYRIATNRCLNMLRDSGRRPATAARAGIHPPGAHPLRRGAVARALSRRAARRHRRRRGRSGSPLRDPRGGNARVPHRASSPPAPPARRARASRRAGVLRHRGRRDARYHPDVGEQRAHPRPRDDRGARAAGARPSAAPPISPRTRARRAVRGRIRARRCGTDRRAAGRGRVAGRCLRSLTSTKATTRSSRSIAHAFARRDNPHRLIPTRANSQPAFGQYVKDPHTDVGRALGLLVLTLDGDRISHITRFAATSALPHFGLPRTIPW